MKGHTWLYRRNYPQDVALALGQQALKQSLKTRDASVARVRSAEINARYETLVAEVRSRSETALSGSESPLGLPGWAHTAQGAFDRLRATLEDSGTVLDRPAYTAPVQREKVVVGEAARQYLNARSNELRPSGFKSVRYSVGLFASKYSDQTLCSLTRGEGREFLSLIARLSP